MAGLLTVGRRRQGQGRRLPGRLPQAGHHRAAARRQRVRAELRLGGHRHPLRARCGPQRRRQRRRFADQYANRARASSPTSPTTSTRSTSVACNKKVTESLIKAGAFDSLEPSAQGAVPGAHRRRRLGAGHQEGRGDGPVRPVRRRRRRADVATRCSPSRCPTRSGTTSTSSAWNARCWGCTCPAIRSTAWRICSPPRSTPQIPAILDGDVANDATGQGRRDPRGGRTGASTRTDCPGRQRNWRISPAASRCCSSRRPTRCSAPRSPTTPWCWSARRCASSDDRISLIANELVVPDFSNAAGEPSAGGQPADPPVHDRQGHRAQAGAGPSSGHRRRCTCG